MEGRYLIDRFLDSGASGHVYRAQGLRIPRQFAIKMVDTARYQGLGKRQELIERFHSEVETLSALRNPHAVAIYEAVSISDTVLGLVMEYINGQTLTQVLEEKGALELEQALEILRQISNGLYEAHQKGIIHRDLKPDNIMIESMPAAGYFVRILDFGVAQITDSAHQTQGFRGSPLYASPEQCLGTERLDPRSDIYSLGCLIYHLLTGQPPFPFTNALQVMDAHLTAPRPRLKDARHDLSFPQEIEHLIAHMLCISREERPKDLRLIHQQISRFLQGQPMDVLGIAPTSRRASAAQKSDPAKTTSWQAQKTPPATDFISLNERTSAELGQEPTFSSVYDAQSELADAEPRLILLYERPIPSKAVGYAITAAALDRRGLLCAVADYSPQTYVLGLQEEDSHFHCFGQSGLATALAFHPSQDIIFSADIRGALSSLSPATGEVQNLANLAVAPLTLEFVPEQERFYFGTERGALCLRDLRTGVQREIARFPHALSALESHTPSSTALVGLWDGSIARLNLNGALQWHLPIAPDVIAHIGMLDDARYFALDHQGTLYIGGAQQGEILTQCRLGPGLRALRRLEDGRLLGFSISNDVLQVWRLTIDP